MNGYDIIANGYKGMAEQGIMTQAEADKEIRILEFLSSCDKDDICRLVDSSAFNTIIKSYCRKALADTEVSTDTQQAVLDALSSLFDSVPAKEIQE